jgi:DNA-binding MarR family transcriptional regulator
VTPESDPIEAIHRSIIAFSRSARTRANDMYEGLSFVAYTLLSYVDVTDCPHASDLAAEYGLDKSTVSRQLAELEESGLLRQVADPLHSRKQRLELTCEGSASVATTKARQRQRLEQQLSGWSQEDVDTFGELFWRFVSGLG